MTARINCASIRKYFGVIVLIAAVMVASKFF
jgi:hypothetical protein